MYRRASAQSDAPASGGIPLGNLAAKLDMILAAIERGQIIALDGDKIVGGTAERMNAELGLISAGNTRNVR